MGGISVKAKKVLSTIILVSLMVFAFSFEVQAASKFYWASCRTGGGDCLDGIDGAILAAGDGALVAMDAGSTTPEIYFYRVYGSSAAESDPSVISPDANAGTLRWHLVNLIAATYGTASPTGVKISGSNGTMTWLGLGDGQDEDLKWDFNTKADTILLTSPASGATNIESTVGFKANAYVTGLMPPVVITTASGTATQTSNTVLTHADDSSATDAYVGMTVYNITDTQSCTVTASTNTTMTCVGSSMAWDNTDAYQVGPGPYQSGSWFYVTNATTIRHPATVGYVVCYESDAAAVLTVDMASGSMIFQGTLDTAVVALDAGDSIDSSGTTTGDFICIHNKSATEAQGKGKRGVWVDGGAT
jgi:hypothetical protein